MFEGKAKPLSDGGLDAARRALDIDLPALWAVMSVETKGCGFLADRRPVILFERHIFHRRTNSRFDAEAPDLSNARAGGYGPGGAAQYVKLERAIALPLADVDSRRTRVPRFGVFQRQPRSDRGGNH